MFVYIIVLLIFYVNFEVPYEDVSLAGLRNSQHSPSVGDGNFFVRIDETNLSK